MLLKLVPAILLMCTTIHAQLSIHPDCDSLKPLPFKNYLMTGTKGALKGPGKVFEIKGNQPSNKYYFEEEHHTAWFKFTVPITGELVMNITPYKKNEDLDFLIFQYNGSDVQEQIVQKSIKPIRSNMARGDSTMMGITGLSSNGTKEFEPQGVGNSFSQPIKVTKGDVMYLVVDNVHNENGFLLELGIQNEINIEGITTDENNLPVKSEITVVDQNGLTIFEDKTSKLGKFDFSIKVWESASNILIAQRDSAFFFSTEINTDQEKDYKFTDLRLILPLLKKGKKYEIGILNFYENSPVLVLNCRASLESLYMLLKKNPTLKIRIEGHVNDPYHAHDPKSCQDLSDNRSKTVYDYLVLKGIDPSRLEKIGLSCKFPLFPDPMNSNHERRNRRVEINVLDY